MTQAPRKNSHLVDLDRTPAHHRLTPGDWWQFIFNGTRYHVHDETVTLPWQVGDVVTHQFDDEVCWRQFRIVAIPLEGVYECNYISQCSAP